MKDVRVRESTIAINEAMSRILPFPCMFQIVADKISAFDQAMMQPYQVIILPLRCTESFGNACFLEYIARVDDQSAPEVIYLASADDGNEDESKRLLHLTEDSSIPVQELAQLLSSIVFAPAAHLPTASVSSRDVHVEDISYTQDVRVTTGAQGSVGRIKGSKRKLTLAKAHPVPVAAAVHRGAPRPSLSFATATAAAYQQYWLAAQAQGHAPRQWLLQHPDGSAAFPAGLHPQAFPTPPRVHPRRRHASVASVDREHAIHRVVTAENAAEEDHAFFHNPQGMHSLSASSNADLGDEDADSEALSFCLDGFDDSEELFILGLESRA
jgi:hypothetical protein